MAGSRPEGGEGLQGHAHAASRVGAGASARSSSSRQTSARPTRAPGWASRRRATSASTAASRFAGYGSPVGRGCCAYRKGTALPPDMQRKTTVNTTAYVLTYLRRYVPQRGTDDRSPSRRLSESPAGVGNCVVRDRRGSGAGPRGPCTHRLAELGGAQVQGTAARAGC
jgi:hypothetical protein